MQEFGLFDFSHYLNTIVNVATIDPMVRICCTDSQTATSSTLRLLLKVNDSLDKIEKSGFSTRINFVTILAPLHILIVLQEVHLEAGIEGFGLFVAMVPQSAVSFGLVFKSFQIEVSVDSFFFFSTSIFHKTDGLNLKIFAQNFPNMFFFSTCTQKTLTSQIRFTLGVFGMEQVHDQLKLAFDLTFLQEFHGHFRVQVGKQSGLLLLLGGCRFLIEGTAAPVSVSLLVCALHWFVQNIINSKLILLNQMFII